MAGAARKRDRVATRAAILEAARDLFVSDGFERASIRRIAERAGCAHGTLYLYFRDKDDLLQQLIEEQFVLLQGRLRALPRTLGTWERLRETAVTILRFGLEMPDHFHLIMSTRPSHAPDDDRRLSTMADEMSAFLIDGVVRAAGRRQLRSGSPQMEAHALLALIHGVVELGRSQVMDASTAEAVATRGIDLVLAGMRVAPEPSAPTDA
ncbi:MAG TPA: TetR/AcrR family transcriptional regulator [Thermomicrobiales bacterium]|nr:TetR/AcrR family transcriptional regulator [Thermomicrobiales bacterium]